MSHHWRVSFIQLRTAQVAQQYLNAIARARLLVGDGIVTLLADRAVNNRDQMPASVARYHATDFKNLVNGDPAFFVFAFGTLYPDLNRSHAVGVHLMTKEAPGYSVVKMAVGIAATAGKVVACPDAV
jgi:hypothetical protein